MEIYTDSLQPEDIYLNYSLSILGLNTTSRVLFGTLDSYMILNIKKSAVYNVAIGSCLVLMLLLWVIIKNRKNVIFIINQVILLLMVIRSSLYLSYQVGPLASLSFTFTNILNDKLKISYNVVLASDVCQILLVGLIEMSMTYQIYIIFKSPEVRKIGHLLCVIVSFLGIGTISLYIYSVTLSSKSFYHLFVAGSTNVHQGSWVSNTPFILFSITINIMSVLLVVKLFFAIKTRRYLGLRQFDSFHILLIMATQTMVVPSVLVIVNYFLTSQSDNLLSTCSFLLVVLSLPLTSMWAAAANNYSKPISMPINIFEDDIPKSRNSSIAETSYTFFPSKLSKLSKDCSDIENDSINFENSTINFENREFTKFVPNSANSDISHNTLVQDVSRIVDPNSKFSRIDSFDKAIQSMGPNTYEAFNSHNLRY